MRSGHLIDQGAPSLLQKWQLCFVQTYNADWQQLVLGSAAPAPWQAEATRP